MFLKRQKIAKELALYMKMLFDKELTTLLGGNISYRNENTIFITPSQLPKNKLSARDIVQIDFEGNVISGNKKPSMEKILHIQIYKNNPKAKAIIHAHPRWATLLAISDLEIKNDYTDEGFYFLQNIQKASYASMGTIELAQNVAKCALSQIIILQNHGVVSISDSLEKAFEQLQVLENMVFYSCIENSKDLIFNKLTTDAKDFLKKFL